MSEIWKICPSCGGVLGRDCFNPEECASIKRERQEDFEREQEEIRDQELAKRKDRK